MKAYSSTTHGGGRGRSGMGLRWAWGGALALLACMLLGPRGAWAQEEQVQKGLAQGAAEEVARYFEAEVEVNLLGAARSVPRAEAERQLAQFFTQHPPTGFSREHMASRRGATFMIGTLVCGKARYRVTTFFRGEGASKRLFKLEIAAT